MGLGGPQQLYVMMQVHYNNPDLDSSRSMENHFFLFVTYHDLKFCPHADIVDSSGLSLIYTSTIPINEAGVLTLGVVTSPFLIIPPMTSAFNVYGWCTSDFTADVSVLW